MAEVRRELSIQINDRRYITPAESADIAKLANQELNQWRVHLLTKPRRNHEKIA
jgi:hypothetical protein